MNYDKQKIEAGSSSETQRAETAANKFFDMADKTNPHMESEREKREMFSAVGTETVQGNYDKAQRNLEVGAQWDDNLRGAASEVNQLNQERTGAKPMTLEDVQKTIGGYARDFEKMSKEKGGRQSDLEGAMAIDNIVGDISEPGIEGIDNALEYLEGTLKSKNNTADSILKSVSLPPEDKAAFLKDWQDKRAMRDALFQEKQKRVEQMKQSQRGTEELTKGRLETAHRLENLFGQAAVPEDLPMRQEFSARVGRMAPEELHFLDASLQKTLAEFARTGRTKEDTDRLEARLSELSTMSFSRSAVERRQQDEDQRKINQIHAELGVEESSQTPTTKEEPRQEKQQKEQKAENPFQTLANSPETYLDRLKDEGEPNTYYPKKAIGAVMEVLQKLYPDKKQRTNRIQEIFGQYGAIRDENRKKRPDADESSHENFATNQTAQRLSGAEQQALEKIIEDKINISQRTFAGESKMRFTKEYVLGSFIQFLEGIKK